MTIHELKIQSEFFEVVRNGTKTFELRVDDRLFQFGDLLVLREWLPDTGGYTGREVSRRVTYVYSGLGLVPGWVCMGIRP